MNKKFCKRCTIDRDIAKENAKRIVDRIIILNPKAKW